MAKFGQILAIFLSLTYVGASLGAGNMFQSNQCFAALVAVFPNLADYSAFFSELTAIAFQQVIPWFPWILVLVILLFALSTMITWCYYGEKSWEYLFGQERSLLFKIVFLLCIILGAVVNLGAVVDFSDIMLLTMSIPNLIGCFLLSQKVVSDLRKYIAIDN